MVDKEFLRIHAEHRSELEDEMRRCELIRDVSYYRSPSNSEEGIRAQGSVSDPTAEKVIRKVDWSNIVTKLQQTVADEEKEIERVLEMLKKADQKTVIRIKYYQRYDWDDIALFMYGDKADCIENAEKYKTKAQKLHGTALANMRRVQQEKTDENEDKNKKTACL